MNLELHSKLQKSRMEEFTKFIEENSWTRGIFTLDNIYKYSSDEELSAIVHSILNRTEQEMEESRWSSTRIDLTDKDIAEVVKGLRTPQ